MAFSDNTAPLALKAGRQQSDVTTSDVALAPEVRSEPRARAVPLQPDGRISEVDAALGRQAPALRSQRERFSDIVTMRRIASGDEFKSRT